MLNGAPLEMGTERPSPLTTGPSSSSVFRRAVFEVSAVKDAYIAMSYGATRPGRTGARVAVAAGETARVAIRLPRGAVITGSVTDVDGLPAQGVRVAALARRFSRFGIGDVQYATAGTPAGAVTDDCGTYRIYGVPAGDYVVAVQAGPVFGLPPGTTGTVVQVMSGGKLGTRKMLLSDVFHPGVTDVARATRVTVRAGEERAGVDIQLEYVPLATITGTVNVPAGFGPARVTLSRMDELTRPPGGPVTSADNLGRFQFPLLAPGQYRITARATGLAAPAEGRGGGTPGVEVQDATADVMVNGDDVDVTLATQSALAISGRLVFESDRASPPALPSQLRVNVPAMASGGTAWGMPPIVFDGTRFRMEGIVPGAYRVTSGVRGIRTPIGSWWLTSLVAGGRDLLDAPLDIQQSIDDAVATLSDRASEMSGRVLDPSGAAAPEAWVVVFAADRAAWFFNSRRIAAVQPDREGRYSIRNLPPGDYRILATSDLEPGEWFDPLTLERLLTAAGSTTVTGVEKTTRDLVIRDRP